MRVRVASLTVSCLVLASCVSPIVIDDAVLSYDRALSRVRSKVLLLNIARARAGLPLGGAEVAALTAQFEFEVQAEVGGAAAPIGGPEGPTGELSLGLTTRAAEAPTLSIVPLQGEELTRRFIAPLDDVTFELLLHRGVDLGLLLRLLGQAIVVEPTAGQRVFSRNDPDRPDELTEFHRRVMHLDALAAAGQLDVGPITRREEWRPRFDVGLEDITHMLDHGFELVNDAQGPLLWRKVDGRMVITNYAPDLESEAERQALELRAKEFPTSFVLVDVRPDGPGGAWPFQGWIKLRSLRQVIDFVARDIDADWERPVAPHQATEGAPAQPARTIIICEGTSKPDVSTASVELHGTWYWLPVQAPGTGAMRDWNQRAFQLLMDLYHLTTRNAGAPPPVVVTAGGG